MSQVLFRKVDYSLSKLIEDIDLGEIGLPDVAGAVGQKHHQRHQIGVLHG